MTTSVQLPNGKLVKATYRSEFGSAAYVRIGGKIVSGIINYIAGRGFVFNANPKGKNAHLVESLA